MLNTFLDLTILLLIAASVAHVFRLSVRDSHKERQRIASLPYRVATSRAIFEARSTLGTIDARARFDRGMDVLRAHVPLVREQHLTWLVRAVREGHPIRAVDVPVVDPLAPLE